MYRADPAHGFWNWSLPCGTLFGITLRLHWSLFLVMAFRAVGAIQGGLGWLWLPALLLIPVLSVLLHELGHLFMARLAGGRADDLWLWAFGGVAQCDAPARPLPQFAVAAAGPAVNLAIALACSWWLHTQPVGGDLPRVVAFTESVNWVLLLFNLLPCYPLDGGRMLRSLLWRPFGRARAVRWTLTVAWVCLAGMALWSFWTHDMFLLGLALLLAFSVFSEQVLVRDGYDPEFGEILDERQPSWWDDRQAAGRRRERAREQADAERDQEELDRLLEKVSSEGLHRLSDAERSRLRAISQRQRERGG